MGCAGKTRISVWAGENEMGRIEVCGPGGALSCRGDLFRVRMCRWLLLAWFGLKHSSMGCPNPVPGKEQKINHEWAGWDELILRESKNQGFAVIIYSRRTTTTANYLSKKEYLLKTVAWPTLEKKPFFPSGNRVSICRNGPICCQILAANQAEAAYRLLTSF